MYTKSNKLIHYLITAGIYIILVVFLFLFAVPFYLNFVFATKSVNEIFTIPPSFAFGGNAALNLKNLLGDLPYFWTNFYNTVMISVLSTVTQIFFCTMAGFAFAKYYFKGKEAIYQIVLISLMLPPILSIIPLFRMIVFFKWTNTWAPLIVPYMANAFGVFLMTQFIKSAVPEELISAARIDGLGEWGILWQICFPLARPGLAILGTVAFVNSWNEFVVATVMLNTKQSFTLPVAIATLNWHGYGDYGAQMMANAINITPLVLIFLVFSKQIIANLTAGAIKQ